MIRLILTIELLILMLNCKNNSDTKVQVAIPKQVDTNIQFNKKLENIVYSQIDTLDYFEFVNNEKGIYALLYFKSIDSLNEEIAVLKDSVIFAKLRLPIPDDEIKNFEVVGIEKTNEGFLINCSWGGGEDLYHYKMYFELTNNSIYLKKIKLAQLDGVFKLKPEFKPIDIKEVNLIQIFENGI